MCEIIETMILACIKARYSKTVTGQCRHNTPSGCKDSPTQRSTHLVQRLCNHMKHWVTQHSVANCYRFNLVPLETEIWHCSPLFISSRMKASQIRKIDHLVKSCQCSFHNQYNLLLRNSTYDQLCLHCLLAKSTGLSNKNYNILYLYGLRLQLYQ